MITCMREKIGTAAMLEQLGEESAELAQAALKEARIIRGENPTPVTLREAKENLQEEYSDVVQCAIELGLTVDTELMKKKLIRFLNRWERTHPDSEKDKNHAGSDSL